MYWFPILYGLPVLLTYETPITKEFTEKYKSLINEFASNYGTPEGAFKTGEDFTLRSFSKEWIEYEYDGVIWGWSYEDREKTLLTEIGLAKGEVTAVKFLEVVGYG